MQGLLALFILNCVPATAGSAPPADAFQPMHAAVQTGQGELVPEILEVTVSITDDIPPVLKVSARGQVSLGGWTAPELIRVRNASPPEDGIQDFEFRAKPPEGAAITVISEISAATEWETVALDAPWLRGIRIHGEGDGVKEIRLDENQRTQLRSVRAFVGVSERRSLDEALADALGKLDQAMSEGPVADGMANWQMGRVQGTVGGIAGLDELRVTVYATRTPPWE
jgi:hypothetical protein